MRPVSESELALARDALLAGERALPRYSHARAPKTFTQPQLFAVLVLRSSFRVGYRAVTEVLRSSPDLRQALGLRKVPHYSTLCHAEQRIREYPGFDSLLESVLRGPAPGGPPGRQGRGEGAPARPSEANPFPCEG